MHVHMCLYRVHSQELLSFYSVKMAAWEFILLITMKITIAGFIHCTNHPGRQYPLCSNHVYWFSVSPLASLKFKARRKSKQQGILWHTHLKWFRCTLSPTKTIFSSWPRYSEVSYWFLWALSTDAKWRCRGNVWVCCKVSTVSDVSTHFLKSSLRIMWSSSFTCCIIGRIWVMSVWNYHIYLQFVCISSSLHYNNSVFLL